MIRRLRIKFVCINMAIVTVMLCFIFVMVLSFTRENLERESIGMMQAVAADPRRLGVPGEPAGSVRLPFFALQVSQENDILSSGGGYFDLTDTELLQALLTRSMESAQQTGVLPEYNLRFCRVATPTTQCIVFADISSEVNTMNHLVQNCFLIGGLSFAAFFVISLLLAHWAVKPVETAWIQQRQFVADASHELKTPLTVILSNTQLLQEPEASPETRNRLMENILSVSQQMRGLVESLLDLARVDSGLTAKQFTRVDLSRLAAASVLPFEPVLFERGLTLESTIDPGLFVRGSSLHLRQTMEILLDNARKYAAPGSTVTFTLRHVGRRHCQFSVASAGSQLTAAERKNIFKRFYRADEARSRDGSYGLGLSIAEGIVKAHHGAIWAESRNGVNTFSVRLRRRGP